MVKPFYIKKKNIDDRLVPEVSAADAGKVLGVTDAGKIAPVEGGGGGEGNVDVINCTFNTMTGTLFAVIQSGFSDDETAEAAMVNYFDNHNKIVITASSVPFFGNINIMLYKSTTFSYFVVDNLLASPRLVMAKLSKLQESENNFQIVLDASIITLATD